MADPHVKILEAAGITQQPYPLEAVPKILNYSLLRNRVFDLLVEEYAADVLATRFHEAELKALRVHCRVESSKPSFRVTWSFISAELSQNNQAKIVAKSYIGENQAPDETFYFVPRTIEEARAIRFRGQAIPGDVLYQCGQFLNGPSTDWSAEMRLQQRYDAEKEQKDQGVLKGDLAVAVMSQPAVGGK
jgi:hypothetical protein